MHTWLLAGLILLVQVNVVVFCTPNFGSVFPLPLTISNDDPDFQQCPVESGAYAHTRNCSLFHMCTFSMHAIYSCIDGFFFNPNSGKCQYWNVNNEFTCTHVMEQMPIDVVPLDVNDHADIGLADRRKSATSSCSQPGIYPDVLDCSLFHYCRSNEQHDVFECPQGLNFDPKIFVCLATELVDCQYEPTWTEKLDLDSTSTHEYDTPCENNAPGTRLPVNGKYDEFITCEENGAMVVEKCPSDFAYHPLVMACVEQPCALNSTLCENQGQCLDDPTDDADGFRCLCVGEYSGKYCEERSPSRETSPNPMETSTYNFLQLVNLLTNSKIPITSPSTVAPSVDHQQEAVSYTNTEAAEKILLVTNVSTTKSSSSPWFYRFTTNRNDPSQQVEQLMRMIYIIVSIFIASALIAMMAFFVFICARLLSSPPLETVGKWNNLVEESKV